MAGLIAAAAPVVPVETNAEKEAKRARLADGAFVLASWPSLQVRILIYIHAIFESLAQD